MAMYYVVSIIFVVVPIAAITAMVIYALNKKGDVSAGFRLNRIGFTLTTKDRSDKLKF